MAIDRSKKSVFRHLGRLIQCIDKRKVALRVLDQDAYDLSIVNTRFAGSYPLMALCDVRPDRPQSSFIDSEYLNNLPYLLSAADSKKIVSIYLCSDALIPFATTVLPKLKRQFILISGDSDLEIYSENLQGAFDLILDTEKLKNSEYIENETGGRTDFIPLTIEPLFGDVIKNGFARNDFFIPE
jgi:hypothetical protein